MIFTLMYFSSCGLLLCLIVTQSASVTLTFSRFSIWLQLSSLTSLSYSLPSSHPLRMYFNCLSIVSGAQPQKFEISESIEQMKIIELGINILAVYTKINYPSVNTPEEVLLVEKILDIDFRQKQIIELIN